MLLSAMKLTGRTLQESNQHTAVSQSQKALAADFR
jgi:hypothetical protein